MARSAVLPFDFEEIAGFRGCVNRHGVFSMNGLSPDRGSARARNLGFCRYAHPRAPRNRQIPAPLGRSLHFGRRERLLVKVR